MKDFMHAVCWAVFLVAAACDGGQGRNGGSLIEEESTPTFQFRGLEGAALRERIRDTENILARAPLRVLETAWLDTFTETAREIVASNNQKRDQVTVVFGDPDWPQRSPAELFEALSSEVRIRSFLENYDLFYSPPSIPGVDKASLPLSEFNDLSLGRSYREAELNRAVADGYWRLAEPETIKDMLTSGKGDALVYSPSRSIGVDDSLRRAAVVVVDENDRVVGCFVIWVVAGSVDPWW